MNKMTQLCVSVLFVGSMGTLFGAAGRDVDVSPQTYCSGNITGNCTITIAPAEVGDVVEFDTTGAPKKELGDILPGTEKSGSIAIPLVNKQQIISFVPKGATPFTGQTIKLLLISFDVKNLPAGSSDSVKNNAARMKKAMGEANVKTMVSAYRQLPGETKWTEFGTTGTPVANLGEAVPLNYTVMPNGQFIIKTQFQLKGVTETLTWNAGLGKLG